jgi:hypothetical protein
MMYKELHSVTKSNRNPDFLLRPLSAISLPAWRHESEKGSTKLHIAALVEPFDAKRERER